ncbi:CbrC family protein [Kribbella yunnanensis]|uniref:CbrC family protein n=1 Tax=Kribbella yunnanensis TaxID=190194 RepID=A0ABP4STK2_9ACTN
MNGPTLPSFRYHPLPVSTGSVALEDGACSVCCQSRGALYTGYLITDDGDDVQVCPWCIADGTAADALDISFTDIQPITSSGIPPEVLDEIELRTPGFTGWQQERWMFHCDDGAAYLGTAGTEALRQHSAAIKAIEAEGRESGWSDDDISSYINSLSRDAPPTAYLFQCLHCSTYLAYSDFT